MNTSTARSVCSIVPPHLLQRLARSDDDRIASAAQRALTVQVINVDRREVRSSRPRPQGPGGRALIPDRLQPDRLPRLVPQQSATTPTCHRAIHDAVETTKLPGTLVRAEGAPPSADESVNEAYDGLGDTWSLFYEVFGRDSLDGEGLELVASVHYDKDFDNAYWDGEQMVFGDGDGVYFSSFTDSVDVIGHELTHGFTQYTAALVYVGQSGALNESISDVFGSMVKQRVRGQSAQQADWLIGEGLFTAKVKGKALRSMKAPGTAYDDPHLGKDPQPDSMAGYQDLPHTNAGDNGGVHINSGIPNRAFYLAATGIGGNSWEGAGPVWFDTVTKGSLPKDSDFATFADATVAAAAKRYGGGSSQEDAVRAAWRTVGVLSA